MTKFPQYTIMYLKETYWSTLLKSLGMKQEEMTAKTKKKKQPKVRLFLRVVIQIIILVLHNKDSKIFCVNPQPRRADMLLKKLFLIQSAVPKD